MSVVVLGAGMHPWGKWGRGFAEYGVAAARAALADAGVDWPRRPVRRRAPTRPRRLSRVRGRGHVRPGAGLDRRPDRRRVRRVRVGGAGDRQSRAPRSSRASATWRSSWARTPPPKGFFAPVGGDRPDDPDWLRFRLLGATNPAYFGLYARRRMAVYGATARGLRPGQGQERPPRPAPTRTPATARRSRPRRCWPPPWSPTRCGCWTSAPPRTAAPRWCWPRRSSPGGTGWPTRCGSRPSPR